jgi:hypothetical protein
MSASKQKGTAWESAIVAYLNGAGFPVERRTQAGAHDKGDVAGLPLVIEAKNCRATELAAWVDEAVAEARNARVPVGVVWHHRRGKASPADGFVTMSGAAFVELLRAAGTALLACVRCESTPAVGFCCSSHEKRLCHRCYRRTHFVEVCVPGCQDCKREDLDPMAVAS